MITVVFGEGKSYFLENFNTLFPRNSGLKPNDPLYPMGSVLPRFSDLVIPPEAGLPYDYSPFDALEKYTPLQLAGKGAYTPVMEHGKLKLKLKRFIPPSVVEGAKLFCRIVHTSKKLCPDPNGMFASMLPKKSEVTIALDDYGQDLDPKYQQYLIPDLERACPHQDFLISTRSPIVIAGSPRQRTVRRSYNPETDKFQLSLVSFAGGSTVERVLVEHFGVPIRVPCKMTDIVAQYCREPTEELKKQIDLELGGDVCIAQVEAEQTRVKLLSKWSTDNLERIRNG